MTSTQLSRQLVKSFSKAGITVSTAESCTGGLIAKLITDISGSSAVIAGGCVSYTNEVKMGVLGVDPAIIDRHTEVSHACAAAMADGARRLFGTTLAVSTTGFAGPGGGTDEDPVGTVYIAVSTPNGTVTERFSAPDGASRCGVRNAAAMRALTLLMEHGASLPSETKDANKL
ncbi:MAG: CinA family protein [Ruminococcaceae bacterium]|nr:CinA family protein [Oscillospiraceae bacterium]